MPREDVSLYQMQHSVVLHLILQSRSDERLRHVRKQNDHVWSPLCDFKKFLLYVSQASDGFIRPNKNGLSWSLVLINDILPEFFNLVQHKNTPHIQMPGISLSFHWVLELLTAHKIERIEPSIKIKYFYKLHNSP